MQLNLGFQDLPKPAPLTFAIILIVITVVSSILSSIIPIIHFIFGRCQSHPTKLIAIICLIDLILGYNLMLISLNIYNIQSGFRIEQIFSLLTFHFKFHPSDVGFCSLNLSLFVILETLSLCFNICLAFDLIITLKQPFLSGKSRQIFYYLFSAALTIGLFFTMTSGIEDECVNERQDQQLIYSDFLFPYPLMGMMIFFEAIAMVTIILASIQLHSKKKKIKAKSFYIRQHLAILVALMISFVFPCLNNFFDIFQIDHTWRQYIRNLSFISLLLSGALVNIVRMTDRYVRKNALLVWSKIIRCNFKIAEEDTSKNNVDAWNVSLNDVVIQFQNQSIIQNIVFVVEEVSRTREDDDILGSTVKVHKEELQMFLLGKDKDKLQKASKLKKKIQTWCVEYNDNDLVNFRNTMINYNNISKRKALEDNNHFKIKATALAYYVFQKIRMMDGLTNQSISQSLNLEKNFQSIKQTKQSLGASGSFFFFTYDKKLIIKTISSQQEQCLLSFLPQYYIHLCENPNTLLSKIYGIYNIEIGNTSKITFLLMQNSFHDFDTQKLKYQIFDMKGSLVKRQVKDPKGPVFKDVNFLKLNQSFIFMKKIQKQQFIQQVKRDITMLADQNIMDYSLLLGITTIDENDKKMNSIPEEGKQRIAKGRWKWMESGKHLDQRVYSISIIDYLQKFNCQKYLQLKYKTFFSPKQDVSCIDTHRYFERYLKFLDSIIVVIND